MSQKVWLMIIGSVGLLLLSGILCIVFWGTDNFVYAGCCFVFGIGIALNLKEEMRTCVHCSYRFIESESEVSDKKSSDTVCRICPHCLKPFDLKSRQNDEHESVVKPVDKETKVKLAKSKKSFLISIGRIPDNIEAKRLYLELIDELETGSLRLDQSILKVKCRYEDTSITNSYPGGRRSVEEEPFSDTFYCPDFIKLFIENSDKRDVEFDRDLENTGWWKRTISNQCSAEIYNSAYSRTIKWTIRISPEYLQAEFIKDSYSDTSS